MLLFTTQESRVTFLWRVVLLFTTQESRATFLWRVVLHRMATSKKITAYIRWRIAYKSSKAALYKTAKNYQGLPVCRQVERQPL